MVDAVRICAVVPVYNHAATLADTVAALGRAGVTTVVVDDGSDAANAAAIESIVAAAVARTGANRAKSGSQPVGESHPEGRSQKVAIRLRLERNSGKGAAVKCGLRRAAELGYTHALQVDADGQHDLADVERFVATARAQPDAIVIGVPRWSKDAPLGRRVARHLTHVWVWINTLSFDIDDSMCGFRIYPLATTLRLLDATGDRMEFDVEILVRAHWQGIPFAKVPTQVRYPADGVSHFRFVRDNALISMMHARLFFGMVRRLPQRFWRWIGRNE